jgi:hypothetical protein
MSEAKVKITSNFKELSHEERVNLQKRYARKIIKAYGEKRVNMTERKPT